MFNERDISSFHEEEYVSFKSLLIRNFLRFLGKIKIRKKLEIVVSEKQWINKIKFLPFNKGNNFY